MSQGAVDRLEVIYVELAHEGVLGDTLLYGIVDFLHHDFPCGSVRDPAKGVRIGHGLDFFDAIGPSHVVDTGLEGLDGNDGYENK